MRQNFKQYIQKGNKLSGPQIKSLNSVWKKDYVDHLFNEGDQIQEELGWCQDQIIEADQEIMEL